MEIPEPAQPKVGDYFPYKHYNCCVTAAEGQLLICDAYDMREVMAKTGGMIPLKTYRLIINWDTFTHADITT